MPRRTVRAVRAADGHVALLEHVDLPKDQEFPVTLDLPGEARSVAGLPVIPTRDLGPLKGSLTRDEIYDDLI